MGNRNTLGHSLLLAAASVLILSAAGCQSTKPVEVPVTVAPPSVEDFASIKSKYLASSPDIRVGRVSEVLASESLARVSDVPLDDFPVTSGLVIVDTNGDQIATAVVDRIDGDSVVIKYAGATRELAIGDIALRFTK